MFFSIVFSWSTTSYAWWSQTACFLHTLEGTNKWTVLHWLDNSSQASKNHTVLIDLPFFLLISQKFALFKTWALILGICIMSYSITKHTKLSVFTCCSLTESQLALWTELNSVIRLGERVQSPIISVNDWGGYVLHRKRRIYLHTTTAELRRRYFLQLTSGETAPLCWEGPSNGIQKRSVLISCLQST